MTRDEWIEGPEGQKVVEAMARSEHEYEMRFGTPGSVHRCPAPIHAIHVAQGDPCDGTRTEREPPSWEDEDEHIRENIYREDARRHLRAALSVTESDAPLLVTRAQMEPFATIYEAEGYPGEWWVTDSPPEVEGARFTLTRCEPAVRVLPWED